MVCHFAPISRKKLIELTGLRPTNVGDLMKELLDEGLVIESGSYSAGPGRKRILLDIYNGIDPNTGEALPENHTCRSMKVACALHIAIRAIDGVKIGISETERVSRLRQKPRVRKEKVTRMSENSGDIVLKKTKSALGNSGTRWTQYEMKQLVYLFEREVSYNVIAKELRRTPFEVEEKLKMMRHIKDSAQQ